MLKCCVGGASSGLDKTQPMQIYCKKTLINHKQVRRGALTASHAVCYTEHTHTHTHTHMQPFIHYCHTQRTHAERKETLQKINHMNLHFTSAISLKTEFKIKIRLRLISGSYEAHRNTAGVFTDHHGTDVRNMNI